MKRVVENQQDYFFDMDNANKYLEDLKNSSKARYSNFLANLKKMDIKGHYLEVGCGPGILTQIVARQHTDVKITATDISPEMIKLAEQDLAEDLKLRINYEVEDACNIDLAKDPKRFDLIYSTFTMHHWNDAGIAIKNLYAMLNTNGVLYIQDLIRVFWLYYIRLKGGFFTSIRASYKKNEISNMLYEIGIKNFQIKTIFPFFMMAIIIRK